MKKVKSQKGITLVALVLTMIVLLILAMISIRAATGENGLVKRAKETKKITANSTKEEEAEMEKMAKDAEEDGTVEATWPTGNEMSTDGVISALPKISQGMTPIKYDEEANVWVETNSEDREWYNYSDKKWANVKLKDGSMLVWIPRYAYRITSGWNDGGDNQAGEIDIVFIDTEDRDIAGRVYDGTYENATKGALVGQGMKSFVVHPAFNYGETKLTGIWVGKFETSYTGCTTDEATGNNPNVDTEHLTAQIKPDVTSWRNVTIDNMYKVCINMNSKPENVYGLNTDDKIVDPHLLKNTEWGCVTYLSKSKFGADTQMLASNTSAAYITGSYGAGTLAKHHYNGSDGVKASTTGNIYGIYDMAGGAAEMTASVIVKVALAGATEFVKGPTYHYDNYASLTTLNAPTAFNAVSKHYGDSMYETSIAPTGTTGQSYTWFGGIGKFWDNRGDSGNWGMIHRGGVLGTTGNIFSYNATRASKEPNVGFRICIAVL